jgi:opacity protein-like surface antigen
MASAALCALGAAAQAQPANQPPVVVNPQPDQPVIVNPSPSYQGPPGAPSYQTTPSGTTTNYGDTPSSGSSDDSQHGWYHDTNYAGVGLGPYVKLGYLHGWGAERRFGQADGFEGGVGMRFSPMFRVDLTYDDRRWGDKLDTGGIKSNFKDWSAMANAYADFNFPIIRPFIPYIGGGIGVAENSVAGQDVSVGGTTVGRLTGSSKAQFAWQAIAGLSYYFTPYTALDVSYHYFDGGRVASSSTAPDFPGGSANFHDHEVVAALRIGF